MPQWNPGGLPPGGNPPGGKKTPWVPIAVIGGVLVLILGAVGIVLAVGGNDDDNASGSTSPGSSSSRTSSSTRTSKTSTSRSSTPTSAPNNDLATLKSLIPAGYPISVCSPVDPPVDGALATMDCDQSTQPGGPSLARFSLYPNIDALNTAFTEGYQADDQVLQCPGSNADSPTSWYYNETPDVTAGQVACGTYEGRADVTWSQDADLMMGVVESDNAGDLTALHDWWLKYS